MVYGQDRVGNKIHLFHSIASVDCVVDGLGLLHFPKHRGQPFDTVGHQHKLIFSQWTAEQKPIRLMDGQRLGMKREREEAEEGVGHGHWNVFACTNINPATRSPQATAGKCNRLIDLYARPQAHAIHTRARPTCPLPLSRCRNRRFRSADNLTLRSSVSHKHKHTSAPPLVHPARTRSEAALMDASSTRGNNVFAPEGYYRGSVTELKIGKK